MYSGPITNLGESAAPVPNVLNLNGNDDRDQAEVEDTLSLSMSFHSLVSRSGEMDGEMDITDLSDASLSELGRNFPDLWSLPEAINEEPEGDNDGKDNSDDDHGANNHSGNVALAENEGGSGLDVRSNGEEEKEEEEETPHSNSTSQNRANTAIKMSLEGNRDDKLDRQSSGGSDRSDSADGDMDGSVGRARAELEAREQEQESCYGRIFYQLRGTSTTGSSACPTVGQSTPASHFDQPSNSVSQPPKDAENSSLMSRINRRHSQALTPIPNTTDSTSSCGPLRRAESEVRHKQCQM